MNLTNFSVDLSGGYPGTLDCGSLVDYHVLQLCRSNSLSNVIVFGGLWVLFLVVNVLHNFNYISDEKYIRFMKSLVVAYIFLGTVAIGSMVVTLL